MLRAATQESWAKSRRSPALCVTANFQRRRQLWVNHVVCKCDRHFRFTPNSDRRGTSPMRQLSPTRGRRQPRERAFQRTPTGLPFADMFVPLDQPRNGTVGALRYKRYQIGDTRHQHNTDVSHGGCATADAVSRTDEDRRIYMRMSLFAVVATVAILAHFVPGWVTPSSQARVEPPAPTETFDPFDGCS